MQGVIIYKKDKMNRVLTYGEYEEIEEIFSTAKELLVKSGVEEESIEKIKVSTREMEQLKSTSKEVDALIETLKYNKLNRKDDYKAEEESYE